MNECAACEVVVDGVPYCVYASKDGEIHFLDGDFDDGPDLRPVYKSLTNAQKTHIRRVATRPR